MAAEPGGCSVQPADAAAFAHDGARAQEAHARHHVGNHARAAIGAADAKGHVDEDGRAHRHQRVGAQARGTLAELALEADDGAQHEGAEQADQRIGQRQQWMFSKFSSCSLAAYCEQGATRPLRWPRPDLPSPFRRAASSIPGPIPAPPARSAPGPAPGEQQVLVRVFHDSLLSVSAIQKTTEWRCSGGQYRDGGAGVVFPMHAAHVRALAAAARRR